MLEKFEHYAFERQLESILTLINYSCSQQPINLGRVIMEWNFFASIFEWRGRHQKTLPYNNILPYLEYAPQIV